MIDSDTLADAIIVLALREDPDAPALDTLDWAERILSKTPVLDPGEPATTKEK